MKIKILITKEILKRAMYCEGKKLGQNCAVGLALFDLFGKRVSVGAEYIWLAKAGQDYYSENSELINPISLPESAVKFIEWFDELHPEERAKMNEFSFEITLPDSLVDEIGINQVHEILSKSASLERV